MMNKPRDFVLVVQGDPQDKSTWYYRVVGSRPRESFSDDLLVIEKSAADKLAEAGEKVKHYMVCFDGGNHMPGRKKVRKYKQTCFLWLTVVRFCVVGMRLPELS